MKRSAEGMASIRSLYKIGRGPSSSHSMGPERAAERFRAAYPDADRYRVDLFGSLSLTGRGHGTDRILRETLGESRCSVVFHGAEEQKPHPNTLTLTAFSGGQEIGRMEVESIGGGDIRIVGEPQNKQTIVYPHTSFSEIAAYCRREQLRLWQYVEHFEPDGLGAYLDTVLTAMADAIRRGLAATGELPGGLHVARRAGQLLSAAKPDAGCDEERHICAYAFAVGEENAAGGRIVTAPTCGSCGVLPAVLFHLSQTDGYDRTSLIRALETAGLVGNLIRTNASISGAECGCQAEIGSACSMAAAASAELAGLGIDQIEYAAEIAMEHHLGLTCDPICGLVQIPCIERNAVAAMRALNASHLATFLTDTRKISFDLVVETMYETGRDLSQLYRETGTGGLAKLYPHPPKNTEQPLTGQ